MLTGVDRTLPGSASGHSRVLQVVWRSGMGSGTSSAVQVRSVWLSCVRSDLNHDTLFSCVGLAMDLAEGRRNLQAESDELGILSATLGVVCDDLEVVWSEGTSSLASHAIEITAWVCRLERNALRVEVNQSFVIAHSHYGDSIDLEMMSYGFAPSYEAHELEEMETAVAPLSQDLADSIESIVLPQRVS